MNETEERMPASMTQSLLAGQPIGPYGFTAEQMLTIGQVAKNLRIATDDLARSIANIQPATEILLEKVSAAVEKSHAAQHGELLSGVEKRLNERAWWRRPETDV